MEPLVCLIVPLERQVTRGWAFLQRLSWLKKPRVCLDANTQDVLVFISFLSLSHLALWWQQRAGFEINRAAGSFGFDTCDISVFHKMTCSHEAVQPVAFKLIHHGERLVSVKDSILIPGSSQTPC